MAGWGRKKVGILKKNPYTHAERKSKTPHLKSFKNRGIMEGSHTHGMSGSHTLTGRSHGTHYRSLTKRK